MFTNTNPKSGKRRAASAGIVAATLLATSLGTLAAAPTAQAASLCGESWSAKYSIPTQYNLFDANVYFKSTKDSAGKASGIKFCIEMVAIKNPSGRKMTINVSSPSASSKSTAGSRLTMERSVKNGQTLKVKLIFHYNNPAYSGGVRTVSTNLSFPVTG